MFCNPMKILGTHHNFITGKLVIDYQRKIRCPLQLKGEKLFLEGAQCC